MPDPAAASQHNQEESAMPAPRSGLWGAWDRFAGPGWSRSENILLVTATLAGTVLVPLLAALAGYGWNLLQYLLAALFALDIIGGAVTMAAAPGKRWYHRPGQGAGSHFGFVLMHLHPLLVAWVFAPHGEGMLWGYGLVGYGYLLVATPALLAAPSRLKRPLATALVVGGCLLNGLVLSPPPGFVWFLPVFYLKLLMSHLVPEKN